MGIRNEITKSVERFEDLRDFHNVQTGGGSYFPYILLNEIQTMFSQLAKRSARVLPADLCTHHAHYVKIHINGLEKKQKHGGRRQDCFSLLYFGNSGIC